MSKLFLLLGGNLGNKKQVFANTLKLIQSRVGEITDQSSIYETEPWGFESDNLFWNQVVLVETPLNPENALKAVQQIEKELGRVRKTEQYTSRVIDLDLLFYDDLILHTPGLEIPHPRMSERRFVLEPLTEIAAEFVHPEKQKTVHRMLIECQDSLKVNKLNG